ncbi:hypothetical protein T552_00286 [Pneumocystis carinii B80]|uniref:N-alpha-acetyltransferase 40 n=1 Tax=Pneumocystis carinii (strain B80) TaxID=1408658 RepID=A0A0W4ZTD5_PNEC8|nr:hypothetical protein T552_00286 [Pneumocystis carinii B80]KTW31647.1 hypothetical protein T552_00286 [Pneumocystis carinii B80]
MDLTKDNIVKIANSLCLNDLKNLMPYDKIYNYKNNDIYEAELFDMKNIKKKDIYSCFCLVKENLEEMYKKSSFGWSSKRKLKEMKAKNTKYIIIRKEKKQDIIGFLSCQFVTEAGEHVIYCYEIQVLQAYRGFGIGYNLMKIMENLGLKLGFRKAMLTVFNCNKIALSFYEKMG